MLERSQILPTCHEGSARGRGHEGGEGDEQVDVDVGARTQQDLLAERRGVPETNARTGITSRCFSSLRGPSLLGELKIA